MRKFCDSRRVLRHDVITGRVLDAGGQEREQDGGESAPPCSRSWHGVRLNLLLRTFADGLLEGFVSHEFNVGEFLVPVCGSELCALAVPVLVVLGSFFSLCSRLLSFPGLSWVTNSTF